MKMCGGLNIKVLDNKTMDNVFKDIDSDGSGEVDEQEMQNFLRMVFLAQRDEIEKLLRKL